MEWYDIVRAFNALVCFICLLYMANKARVQWSEWNIKTTTHWWAFTGWIFIGFEGALENIVLGTKPGPRIILGTMVIVWTAITLRTPGEVRFHHEPLLKGRFKKED